MFIRVLREHPFLLGAASLLIAFGGAYLMFQWAIATPTAALVGRRGVHDAQPGTAATCLDCHVPFRGTPYTRCLAPGCHGSLATGTPPRDGRAMPVRFHAALRGYGCGRCHSEHAGPAVPRVFAHSQIPDEARSRCHACHPGQGIPDHSRTDAVSCDVCHGTRAWRGAPMSHARVTEHACDLCHRPPDDPRHASVAGTCQDCHDTTRFDAAAQPAEK